MYEREVVAIGMLGESALEPCRDLRNSHDRSPVRLSNRRVLVAIGVMDGLVEQLGRPADAVVATTAPCRGEDDHVVGVVALQIAFQVSVSRQARWSSKTSRQVRACRPFLRLELTARGSR
jgi:hypothetical protein